MVRASPMCPKCGYSLSGLARDSRGRYLCPECGRIGPEKRAAAPTNTGAIVAAQIFSWLPATAYIMFGSQWFGVSAERAAVHGLVMLPVSFVVAGVVTVRVARRARPGVERLSGLACFFGWFAFGAASSVMLAVFMVLLASASC